MQLRKISLALATILLAVQCGQKEAAVAPSTGSGAAPSTAAASTAGSEAATSTTAAGTAPASTSANLVPQSLITLEEATAILGEEPTFESEAMPAYANAIGFNYHTNGSHYLSATFYPGDGVGMFNNMKRDLPEAKKLSTTPCSGVGDECLFSGSGAGVGMLHAVKGTFYFTLSADIPAPDRKRIYEELGQKVAGRLP
jgi:hypothetical protein